mmetsp:Transcript_22205/g.41326  ORF Transcript_22205/g.41326 Transcript_22205/m.41326 type:complete len:254 (-) Transcript_22205:208-969(-)
MLAALRTLSQPRTWQSTASTGWPGGTTLTVLLLWGALVRGHLVSALLRDLRQLDTEEADMAAAVTMLSQPPTHVPWGRHPAGQVLLVAALRYEARAPAATAAAPWTASTEKAGPRPPPRTPVRKCHQDQPSAFSTRLVATRWEAWARLGRAESSKLRQVRGTWALGRHEYTRRSSSRGFKSTSSAPRRCGAASRRGRRRRSTAAARSCAAAASAWAWRPAWGILAQHLLCGSTASFYGLTSQALSQLLLKTAG